ncbi:hypothetical protein [uncultured Draconibacterium sp.]|uniref:hypothetical protein n=1 Tax=uncultured Draconibacterium sp. TaxID=1573823 RepID=UPI003260A963
MKSLKEQAPGMGKCILESNREAVRRRLQESPILTIHPKVKTNDYEEKFEARCFLNRTAIKMVFGEGADNYKVDFGNKPKFHAETNSKTGERYVRIRSEVMFTEIAENVPEEERMSRVGISPDTGIFESSWLAGMIFHMHDGLEALDRDTVYHFLLLPCSVNTAQDQHDYLRGWELELIDRKPADEIDLRTDLTKNKYGNDF